MPHLLRLFFKGLFAQNNVQCEQNVLEMEKEVEVKIEDDKLKKKGLSCPGSQLHGMAKFTEEAKQWF